MKPQQSQVILGPRLTSRRPSIGEEEKNTKHKHACRIRRQPFEYYIVVDFEATCEENNPNYMNEIIEFPLVLLRVDQKKQQIAIVDSLQIFVKPTLHPTLTEFCTQLTGITQQQVDNGVELSDAFEQVHQWLQKHNLVTSELSDFMSSETLATREQQSQTLSKLPFAFVTDGPYDFYNFLHKECEEKKLTKPIYFSSWVNIRKCFQDVYDARPFSLIKMLDHLNISFEGNHHSGLDDSLNIAKIAMRIVEDGGKLDVNDHAVDYIQMLKPQPFNVLVIVDLKTSTSKKNNKTITGLSAIAMNMNTLEIIPDQASIHIQSSVVDQKVDPITSVGDMLKEFSKWLRKHNLVKSRFPNRSKKNACPITSSAIAFADTNHFELLKQCCLDEKILFPKYLNKWVNLSTHAKAHVQRNGMSEIDHYIPEKSPLDNYSRMTREMLNKGAVLYTVNSSIVNKSVL